MKKFNLILLFAICWQYSHAQATLEFVQESRTLTNKHVIIYLDTTHLIDVHINYINEPNLTIHTKVKCPHGKKAILEYLKRDGRYNLKIYEHSKFYATVISMTNEIRYVFINNNEYMESISYEIELPEGTTYDIRVPQSTQPKQMPIAVK